MVAIEAKYHHKCLVQLYNRARTVGVTGNTAIHATSLENLVFAELVSYIEDLLYEETSVPVFKLADLAHMYTTRLEELGATSKHRTQTTRLKERLLSALPNLRAYTEGRDLVLTFNDAIGGALKKACDKDNDALHLARAARIVRREMFQTSYTFDGSFREGCQEDSVPQSLLALVKMILDGPSITHQGKESGDGSVAASLTISQLILFSSVKHTRFADSSSIVRRRQTQETPLPLYIAFKIHAVTRSRTLIDTMYSLGICVGYDRLLQLTSSLGNRVCQQFVEDGFVCPTTMRKKVFTTSAVDNVDHNQSSTTSDLVQADIATTGTADSFISASHVTKTRHAHQVSVASIWTLLQKAYDEYRSEAISANTQTEPFETWCTQRAQQSVQFNYWLKTLSLEIILLLYIRAIREGNFELYVQSLTKIVPWMFALDHTHYSRWLPVHIHDMMSLSQLHPAVLSEFRAGKFVVHKTRNKFSAMAIDQCHEQNNALIKDTAGGVIGLTSNPAAMRRWMVAGPEVARIISEFEQSAMKTRSSNNYHHDQHHAVQVEFHKDVKSLVQVMEEMGNPFLERGNDLIVLDTRDIIDSCAVVKTIQDIESLGVELYEKYAAERLVRCEVPITEVIPKNKLALFSRLTAPKSSSKQKLKVAALKQDCNLFSRLYISCQTREGDLENFFAHENQATPPSLSHGGKLRSGTKADLLSCLELMDGDPSHSPSVNTTIFDGAAIVQMLSPGTAKSFQDYADEVFSPYILSQLRTADRVDIVWDVYLHDSLKATTRERRGKGVRRRVSSTTMIPRHWKDFLHVDENKTELFTFLSQRIACLSTGEKCIYVTDGTNVLCSKTDADLSNLAPCSHEEADTRLLLHVADAVQKGSRKVCVRTVDTDVVVLALAKFSDINPDELWLAFGTGKHFRYIPIHDVVAEMDHRSCAVLPAFHAFTGCDTVSAFNGRSKKTAWNTWKVFPEVTAAFEELQAPQGNISISSMSLLERFVVLLYSRTSEILKVNDARRQLFTQKARSLENLPPTQAALEQHSRRASLQSNCWNQALVRCPRLPSPSDWGWKRDQAGWQPLWTTLPEASQSCYELIHCGCKKGCTGRCKCIKASLKCTALCSCSGECQD